MGGFLLFVQFVMILLSVSGPFKKIWEAIDYIISTPARIAAKVVFGAIFLPFISSVLLEGRFWLRARVLIWFGYSILYTCIVSILFG